MKHNKISILSSKSSPKFQQSSLPDTGERIQKVLARAGLGSRREIERWIADGQIGVNGIKIMLGYKLKPADQVQINGKKINWISRINQPTRVLVYNKPTGVIVSCRDEQNRTVVFSKLPKLAIGRWVTVGRLDINTSGLLLVTTNGELANRLMHPAREVDREYAVRILGNVSDAMIGCLKAGVELTDGFAQFNDIQFHSGIGANKWFYVVIKTGRNRLVRRLWESQGVTVSRLMRVRYGPAVLPNNVKANNCYELNHKELTILMEFAGLKAEK